MKVEELRAALVNVPGITEVTVWRDDEKCCHQVESAYHVTKDGDGDGTTQFVIFEDSGKLQDIVTRGFLIASPSPSEEDDEYN